MNTAHDVKSEMSGMTGRFAGYLGRPAVHVLLLVGAVLISYSNSFHGPFVFDDKAQITDNPVIHSLANFFANGSG